MRLTRQESGKTRGASYRQAALANTTFNVDRAPRLRALRRDGRRRFLETNAAGPALACIPSIAVPVQLFCVG
jgi:hypothetical protein